MSRLIIDITELVTWSGKLTGVPRVMNEITLRYAHNPATVFVTWNGEHSCYTRVTVADVLTPQQATPGTLGEVTEVPPKSYLRLAKKLKNSSAIANASATLMIKAVKKLQSTPTLQKPIDTVKLVKGDRLLILADWHGSDTNLIDYLIKQHHNGVSLVQICYDLLPLVTPQYSGHATTSFGCYTEHIYPLCTTIIAISEHTKGDVQKWFKAHKLTAPAVEIMRLGDDFQRVRSEKPAAQAFTDRYHHNKQFLLCVGTIEARKNHTVLYYAYKRAITLDINLPPLVIVGRKGWLSGDIYEIMTHDPTVKDQFIFMDNTTDEELAWLYEHCLFSVYPSFYEGWGLPVAESVAYGVPCVASSTSSIPEIAGKLLTYFDPSSPDECLQAMAKLCKPAQLMQAKATLQRYQPVSWDVSIANLIKIVGT
jgi:glycosyltransferase involved in cell wall biosynthesis